MTKEEKHIVFKTLCMLLPYKPKVHIEHDAFYDELEHPILDSVGSLGNLLHSGIEIKPYLRSLSSMTHEEKAELDKMYRFNISVDEIKIWHHSEGYWDDDTECSSEDYIKLFDWLNKHHFDYRGLIDKGLAIEAPNEMYKFD